MSFRAKPRNLLPFRRFHLASIRRSRMSIYEKLKSLHITLPVLDPPVAAFIPFVRTGNLVFISGHIAKKDGKPWTGELGAELTTSEGKQAAQANANGDHGERE